MWKRYIITYGMKTIGFLTILILPIYIPKLFMDPEEYPHLYAFLVMVVLGSLYTLYEKWKGEN